MEKHGFRMILTVAALFVTMVVNVSPLCAQRTSEPEQRTETDGFVWYKVRTGGACQVLDADKKVIIPASRGYRTCTYQPDRKYFKVMAGGVVNGGVIVSYLGICLRDGTELISPKRHYTGIRYSEKSNRYVVKRDKYVGVCDSVGREMISPARGYTDCMHKHGYYIVSNGKYEGVCDYVTGKEIVPLKRGYTQCSYNPVRNHIKVKRGNLYGICTPDGKEIIAPAWYDVIYNTAVHKWKGKRTLNSQWEDIKL